MSESSASASNKLVVSQGLTAQAVQIYHCDFPEVRSEGGSLAEAKQNLALQLTRALDSALTDWRRDLIQKTIAEIQAP